LLDGIARPLDGDKGFRTHFASLGGNLPYRPTRARPHGRGDRGDLSPQAGAVFEQKLDIPALSSDGLDPPCTRLDSGGKLKFQQVLSEVRNAALELSPLRPTQALNLLGKIAPIEPQVGA
jgi:hypothetical protein